MSPTTKRRWHTLVGGLLALLGIGVICVELVLHWRNPTGYRIGFAAVGIGATFFLLGWFIVKPKSAEQGSKLWLAAVERLGAVVVQIRTGRRKGDVAFVPARPEPILPMDQQDGDLDNPPHLGAAPELPNIPDGGKP